MSCDFQLGGMTETLTIFLVSAADNLAALTELQTELLAHGHTVNSRALHARHMREMRDDGYLLLMGEDDPFFRRLIMEVAMADLFVLVLPDDHDAAFLAGVAHTSGVPVAAIGKPETPCSFMVRGCVSFWCTNGTEGLMKTIAEWPDLSEEA